MKLQLLDEPLLQFASGTHVDIRAGLAEFGALDRGSGNTPNPLRIGIIGNAATIESTRRWLLSARAGVPSTEKKLRELRPSFPGRHEHIFGTTFDLTERGTRSIARAELEAIARSPDGMVRAVDLFLSHARDVAGQGGIHVLIIAPPAEIFSLGESVRIAADSELDEAQDQVVNPALNFHDLFKAAALELPVPCQIVRPETLGLRDPGTSRRKARPMQDEATRAWNIHTALYYKAGGIPWRLVRHSAALSTCYVGTSFFKSIEGDRLLTSVAQVFNERGEGLIVQGGNARIDRDDRTPHLTVTDADKLLATGLASYRREHKTMPARVLVHKTSFFDAEEIAGCCAAAEREKVEVLDLVSVRRSEVRLLRPVSAAIWRGAALILDDSRGVVHLKGTVPYFRTYPGMYIPRALEFSRDYGEGRPLDLAQELLELSKLNFNNTQFDSGDPITIRAARRVGDILKHVAVGRAVQSRFRYFT